MSRTDDLKKGVVKRWLDNSFAFAAYPSREVQDGRLFSKDTILGEGITSREFDMKIGVTLLENRSNAAVYCAKAYSTKGQRADYSS